MISVLGWAALALATEGDPQEAPTYEATDWADVVARQPTARPPSVGPVLGMADLHLHLWPAGGPSYGPPTAALAPAAPAGDRRAAPGGIASAPRLPHFLGWPAPDAGSAPQAWEGWLRLAHDGVPALWFLSQHPEHETVEDGLTAFYADYREHVVAAAKDGAVGLNLVVVSLAQDAVACRRALPKRALRADPAVCLEMDGVRRQYDAVLYWAERNRRWARIVTSPTQAEEAIAAGQLAMVLSIEVADLFGPSNTVGDGAPFAQGYRGFARALAGGPPGPEHVRAALESYLDAFPAVATLQLASHHDSPFAGAAFSTASTLRSQRWRDRLGGSVRDEQGRRWRCLRAAEAWKWGDPTGAPYPECMAQAASELGMPPRDRPGFHLPVAYRRAAEDRQPPGTTRYHHPYGLSVDGQALIDVMAARGMPLDLARISRHAFDEALAHADQSHSEGKAWPAYVSHGYPNATNLLHREETLTRDQLGALSRRAGVVGVRTGADAVIAAGEPGPFADALQTHDCVGTTVSAGLHQQAAFATGVRTAWGTALDDMVDQGRPAAQLRPPAYQDRPCALAVPSIGSEVGQRGLAHIGLLPQMQMQLLAMADDRTSSVEPLPGTLDDALHGSNNFIEMWARTWCASDIADPEDCERSRLRTRVRPWTEWRTWLAPAGDRTGLATIGVELPASGATAWPAWGGNAAVLRGGGAGARSLGASMAAARPAASPGPIQLQRWRALEATLPYRTGAPGASWPRLPQLPTTVGFLVGAHSFTEFPDPRDFPYRQCMVSGSMESTPYQRRWECRPVRDARRRVRHARVIDGFRAPLGAPLPTWARAYPAQRAPGVHEITVLGALPPISLFALGRRVLRGRPDASLWGQLQKVHQDPGAHTTWHDMPSFAATAEFLVGHRACLASGALTAPAPGLPTGDDPVAWLDGASRLASRCYCGLIGQGALDPFLTERDQAARRVCLARVFPETSPAAPAPAPQPMLEAPAAPTPEEPAQLHPLGP